MRYTIIRDYNEYRATKYSVTNNNELRSEEEEKCGKREGWKEGWMEGWMERRQTDGNMNIRDFLSIERMI